MTTDNTQPTTDPRSKIQNPAISPVAPTPPSPDQPHGHVPIFDCYGAIYGWIPREGPGSTPTFPDPIGFNNRHRETICWVYPRNSYSDPRLQPQLPRRVALVNEEGLIVDWLMGEPNALALPSPTAQALNSRRLNSIVAWFDDHYDPFDSPVGGAVA